MSYKDGYKEQTVAAGQNTKERDYWLKKLSGELTRTILPYEFHHPGTGEGKSLTTSLPFQITGSTYATMLKISNKSDVRLHILLLTGWLILLHRYTAANDIIIGVPTYRQTVAGQLINTALALRNPVHGRMTVKELLMQVGQTILEANQNQNYPIQTLVYKLNLPDTGGDFPLFDMSLLLEEIHDKHDLDHIKQNMLISFHKSDTALAGTIEYNDRLYSEEFMQSIITHYRQIMESSLANVETRINRVDIIPAHEKQQLLREFNDNKVNFPRNKIISQVIAEQAERTPDSTAIMTAATLPAASLQVTYSHLNHQSNHLAGLLSEKGVGPETIAAVMMERSIEMVMTILAIFKAGGVYLPIDPDCPQERVDYMLKDSNAGILINKSEIRNPKFETNPNDQNANVQNENKKCHEAFVLNFENLNFEFVSDFVLRASNFNSLNLAYIIYTSGSTGKPKGAMVEHIGMMNHMWAKVRTLQISPDSIAAQTAAPTFDISVWQFFVTLTQGGQTIIYPDSIIMDPHQLLRLLIKNRVTILELVPSYLAILLDAAANKVPPLMLAYLLVTGEEIKPALVNRWFSIYPGIKMVNAYGPTEASDDITQHELNGPIDQIHVPIGKPLQNFDIFILDEQMQLCPIGIKGEICVAGTGVGRGYLNRPELTAERFRPLITQITQTKNKNNALQLDFQHSAFSIQHSILYCTGDLGRWLPDSPPAGGATKGIIEFLGRIDHQVKVRGFRIELGEIENLLAAHPSIKEAVVVDKEDTHGQKYLCAYFVASREGIDATELKPYLSRALPDYMTPAHFVKLSQMPLTPNGKIDRAALPEPNTTKPRGIIYITAEMLNKVNVDPGKPLVQNDFAIDQARVLSDDEKHQILYEFNQTDSEYPHDKTIQQLFEEQSTQTPDAIAVFSHGQASTTRTGTDNVGADPRVCPNSNYPVNLTYRQLNDQSDRLAGLLIEKGVLPDDIVGIMMERSSELIIGILGILKAGGAYLPVDAEYPQERIDYMLKDSNAGILINKSEARSTKLETNSNDQNKNDQNKNDDFGNSFVLNFEHLNFDIVSSFGFRISDLSSSKERPRRGLQHSAFSIQHSNFSNLAYIMYTSGSTGMPKGAMIEHRSVVNFFHGMADHLQFEETDRVLSLITVSFDIFVLEALFPLTRGTRVVLGSEEEQVNPRAAAAMMAREKVNIFQATPAMLNLFLAGAETSRALASLKYLLVGGEELLMPVLEKARAIVPGKIFNLYGPTETTVWSTIKDVSGNNELNIGKPIANTQIYILAEDGQLQPVGAAGELCIGGDGVCRGYLNRPELTAERFDQDEKNKSFFGESRGAIFSKKAPLVYRTGDIARWLPDGSIEFLGRKDHQIQLRGIRVELGEIESILLKQDGVSEAAVVACIDNKGEKYLRAAVVSPGELNTDLLRERLAGELPYYMIPAEFLQLEKMPLTPSGKINRKIIAAIEVKESGTPENTPYIAPETQLQMQIVEIWKEVLNQPMVGIHDNFFDLGGNSLGVILVNNKLKEKLQCDIPALVLFEYPTVAALSRYLEAKPAQPGDITDDVDTNTDRTGIKSKGRDRMLQRKSKLKEERIYQNI